MQFLNLLWLCVIVTLAKASSNKVGTLSLSVGKDAEITLTDGKALTKEIEVTSLETLKITLTPSEELKPLYVAVYFDSAQDVSSNEAALKQKKSFPLKDRRGKWSFSLEASSESGLKPGKYAVTLFIGAGTDSVQWNVGKVSLRYVSVSSTTAVVPDEVDEFAPLPEIKHTFQPDHKMPSVLISYPFTALSVSPVLVLAYMWLKLGANIANFPYGSPRKLLNAGLFLFPLSTFLYVLYLFWIRLNLFQTLALLSPLSAILLFTTRNAVLDMASTSAQ